MKTQVPPSRPDQIRTLFDRALELDDDDRAEFLDRACGRNGALRDQLDRMLAAAAGDNAGVRDLLENLPLPASATLDDAGTDPVDGMGQVGHYKILQRIGKGGMGIVYRAHDTRLDRPVALKFLSLQHGADRSGALRLIREARAASRLDHPNICAVHEIGETPDGRLFIAMAFCDGETLAEKIARGPLPVSEALKHATAMADALSCAHEAGIVHRDLKPANVIVTARGEVKIVDFGLAKIRGMTTITARGSLLGTAAYMSPEQTRGVAFDARTDVWSLGVVVYEMLSGGRPFPGDTIDVVIQRIREVEPAPLETLRPEVPSWLSSAVRTALRKDPEARYGSAAELLRDLQSGRAGSRSTWGGALRS